MKKILLSFLFLNIIVIQAQEAVEPRYYLHALADTSTHPEYVPYIDHWIEFLYTENDSIRRTFWEPEDIQKWGNEYALFYSGLFQYPVQLTLKMLKPYILSMYCKDKHCRITTAFWKLNTDPTNEISKNQNPYGIVEVEVYEKDGQLYISNLFEKRVANWDQVTAGKIKYVVDPNLITDSSAIQKSLHFVDSLSTLLNVDYDSITYVVSSSPNNLGYILGFNYFFMGYTYGRVSYDSRTLFSGVGSFNYPHEFAHLIVNQVVQTKNQLLGEGMPTYFGGTRYNNSNLTYLEALNEFQKIHPIINDSVFSNINKYPNFFAAYVVGAIIVEQVYLKKGIEGLKAIADVGTEPEDILLAISEKFNISREELFSAINKRLDSIEDKEN